MTGKRMIAAIFMLVLSLSFIGCKMQTNATKKLSDLDYTIVSGRELPDELYDILEEKKTESFKLTYEENDGLYLCVGYGQQETGGYSIAVNDLYLTENAIYFDTSLIGPGPEEGARKEKSFPYLTVRIAYLDKPVVFQ